VWIYLVMALILAGTAVMLLNRLIRSQRGIEEEQNRKETGRR